MIARQIKDKQPEQITELVLDNARCTEVTGLLDNFKKLHRLSIVNAGLVTLKGFPSLPNLLELQLGDNKLSGGLDALCGCPLLSQLGLAGNKIGELEDLKPLISLAQLSSLDLYNCPVTAIEEYRSQVFEMLMSLQSLDGLNEKGEELESEGGEDRVEEEEDEDDDDNEPGLDYLLNNDLRSDSEEGDYDPDNDDPASGDDEEFTDEDESGAGPSSSKRPKLDRPQPEGSDYSDTE